MCILLIQGGGRLDYTGDFWENIELKLISTKTFFFFNFVFEPGHDKMCLMPYANNKDTDLCSLISTFIVGL